MGATSLCLLLMLFGLVVPACAAIPNGDQRTQPLQQEYREAAKKIIGGHGHGHAGPPPPLTHYLLLNTGGTGNNRIILNGGGLLLCNTC